MEPHYLRQKLFTFSMVSAAEEVRSCLYSAGRISYEMFNFYLCVSYCRGKYVHVKYLLD